MSKQTSTSSGGIGFVGLLTVLFIGLKLTGFINWSWIWVLSPLWFGFAVAALIFVVGMTFVGIYALIKIIKEK